MRTLYPAFALLPGAAGSAARPAVRHIAAAVLAVARSPLGIVLVGHALLPLSLAGLLGLPLALSLPRLLPLARTPGYRLALVGDGPARAELERFRLAKRETTLPWSASRREYSDYRFFRTRAIERIHAIPR